jgi:hypothetical protein
MTDFRALCTEQAENVRYLLDCVADGDSDPVAIAECVHHLGFTRAALTQPEAEGPSDQELYDLWEKEAEYFALYGEAWRFAHAVLARWGRPALAPKPIPMSERLPEDEDCMVVLHSSGTILFPLKYCWQAKEIMHCGQALLIWNWKPVSVSKNRCWPFTYWLPAATRFLPTTVDSDQPT